MNEVVIPEMPVHGKMLWPMGGDHVMQATGNLPDRQRDLVRWLFFHSAGKGLSMAEAADAIGYDPTNVGRVMRGVYAGNMDKVCEAIERLKGIEEQRANIVKTRFVLTTVAKRIHALCDLALIYQNIALVYGDSQIGKTEALLERARIGGRGAVRYIRLPAAASKQGVLHAFAEACGVCATFKLDLLYERIINSIDANTLVIVDELHLAFETYQEKVCVKVLAMIREIYDRTHCGMILCGTNVAREEIEKGNLKLTLEQLRRRGIFRLQLPRVAPWSDRVAIAASFGLEPPEGHARAVVDEIVQSSGLRAFTSFLQAGGKMAANRKEAFTWAHVVRAYDTVKAYSQFPAERG